MASARRKSAAIALAVMGVAGLSLASAAQLGVTSASLGAGSTVVASCDSTIAVGYATAFATAGYNVSALNLSGVDAKCDGLNFKAQLTSDTGLVGGELSGPLTVATDGTASIALNPAQPAASITGVTVVISGAILP